MTDFPVNEFGFPDFAAYDKMAKQSLWQTAGGNFRSGGTPYFPGVDPLTATGKNWWFDQDNPQRNDGSFFGDFFRYGDGQVYSPFEDRGDTMALAFGPDGTTRVLRTLDTGGGFWSGHKNSLYNDQPYDQYDAQGNYMGSGNLAGMTDSTPGWKQALPIAAVALGGPLLGGALAGMASGAGMAGAGGAALNAYEAGALADAMAAGTAGVGAGTAGGSALSSLSSLFSNPSSLLRAGSTIGNIFSKLGGGGSSSGGGLNLGGNMGDLAGVLASLYGGQQQGNAANEMKSWLQGQQAKIDNLYNPGTAEYNSLWDEMSRKDAAAGRNSQYGPRSVDLAAKLAGIKGDLTTRFTTGTSRAYADALNQYGNRNAGLAGSLGKLLGGAGGASSILSGLSGLSGLFGNNNFDFSGGQSMITPSNMSNQEIDDFINGMSFGTDPAFEDPWTDIFSEWY